MDDNTRLGVMFTIEAIGIGLCLLIAGMCWLWGRKAKE